MPLTLTVSDIDGDAWPADSLSWVPRRRPDETAESWCARVAVRVAMHVEVCGGYGDDVEAGVVVLPTDGDAVVAVEVRDDERGHVCVASLYVTAAEPAADDDDDDDADDDDDDDDDDDEPDA
jgi:hypothetical protein